jgi:hypothetical protein
VCFSAAPNDLKKWTLPIVLTTEAMPVDKNKKKLASEALEFVGPVLRRNHPHGEKLQRKLLHKIAMAPLLLLRVAAPPAGEPLQRELHALGAQLD